MYAAVLSAPDRLPVYQEHLEPVARREGEAVVEVLAAALHHVTRARATGAHYSTAAAFPLVPGIDAVVRDDAGDLRYAVLDDTAMGTFSGRTVIELARSIPIPSNADPVQIAAAMNPAMSSWLALRSRITMAPGSRVLVIGATGNAGRMAVQIAKILGASHVIAAGRDRGRLAPLQALGADELCTLDELDRAADADIVLDYIWGDPIANALIPMLTARRDRSTPLTWIQIGTVAGPTAAIPGAALRSSGLEIIGSGIGSVRARDILAALPSLVETLVSGAVEVRARAVPLAEVASAWTSTSEERIVFVP